MTPNRRGLGNDPGRSSRLSRLKSLFRLRQQRFESCVIGEHDLRRRLLTKDIVGLRIREAALPNDKGLRCKDSPRVPVLLGLRDNEKRRHAVRMSLQRSYSGDAP